MSAEEMYRKYGVDLKFLEILEDEQKIKVGDCKTPLFWNRDWTI